MRIRRGATRLLDSAYFSSPVPDAAPLFEPQQQPLEAPPPQPASPAAIDSDGWGALGVGADVYGADPEQQLCELNRDPFDLMVDLDPSDPQEQELFDETYFVLINFRSSWAVPTILPAASVKEGEVGAVGLKPRDKIAKKTTAARTVVKKSQEECKLKKKADVGVAAAGEALLNWTCKKNDGKRWSCRRLVSQPNSLCVYHSDQKRASCNKLLSESRSTAAPPPALVPPPPASKPSSGSKPSSSSKPRRKRPVVDLNEGFYYYAGFGPSRSSRQCTRSSSMQQQMYSAPPMDQNEAPEEHITAPAAIQAQADDSAYLQAAAQIAGGDEESSDGEPRVVAANGDSRASPLRRWRKPVKARSLKSFM